MSTFTIEAEYIALEYIAQESIWIQKFLNKLEIAEPISACILYRDNKTSIILTKNAKSQTKTKYINMQHHYIPKFVKDKKMVIE